MSVTEQRMISGGHLQGVQLKNDVLYVSGSSSQFGYLAVFKKNGDDFIFLGIKKLAESPLNHAGGFQVAGNWLAIGLEDPKKKNRSIVQLIDISDAAKLSAPPAFTFDRSGEARLSTAGAVGLLQRKDHFMLAVGTWNSTTIDFYTSNHLDPTREDFEFSHWTTWDSRSAIRKNWSDRTYCHYQNLQLTEDSTGVYITGFCRTKNGTDRADVFRMNTGSDPYELLTKVAAYAVQCKGDVSFRNGAGFADFKGRPAIIAVGHGLAPETHIQIFPVRDY